jgi:hypothetical protein
MKGNTLNRMCKASNFVAYLALLTAGSAFTQIPSLEATPNGGTTAPVAWVYVQTSRGVNVYDAAVDGKLTLVKGSPFETTGTMAGSNGSHLITLGTDLVHSYAIESNGAIGKQVSDIDTQDYDGFKCGNLDFGQAVLDHTGRNLYVQMDANAKCAAVQTYDVAKGTGLLSFVGATVDKDFPADALKDNDYCTLLTMTGNNVFGYSVTEPGIFWSGSLIGYRRQSDGALEQISFNEVDPPSQPGGGFGSSYTPPFALAADPTGHLAALTNGFVDGSWVMQLASYTVDKEGNVASTNTWENMPKVSAVNYLTGNGYSPALSMSPSGKLLAVQIWPECQNCDTPWGFQLFHFNGAAPITRYSSVLLPGVIVQKMSWDDSSHLYILGANLGAGPSVNKLYVFTVTPTTITEAEGSPHTITNLGASIVVVSR